MKRKIVLILIVFLLAMPLQGVSADPALPPGVTHSHGLWVVVPLNQSPDDVQRIQAVVDLAAPGDTVQLASGTFDFGDFGNVRIAKDLTLEGSWDARSKEPLTLIKHGFAPVLIGRKTPLVTPELETVDGYSYYHITKDIWGKLQYPFTYPGAENYDIHTDWVPVQVNVRQIAFERPYMSAIYSGAMNGGVIERVRIHSAWQAQLDYEQGGSAATGIAWFNDSFLTRAVAEWGRDYNPDLYFSTDLVRGNLVVRDVFIDGAASEVGASQVDENGYPILVSYADSPVPPGSQYEQYALQDVAFAWEDTGYPVLESIQPYWVKKGYTAWSYGTDVWASTGIWAGVYSLFAQSNLTVKDSIIQDCSSAFFFLENGFAGAPFTAFIEGNQITPAVTAGWGAGLFDLGWDHYIPATGQVLSASPGSFITARNNTFTIRNEGLWLDPVVDIAMYGKAVMQGNRFDLASGVAFYLGYPAQATTLIANRVSGKGDYAANVDAGANENVLLANDLSDFEPTGSGASWLGIPPAQLLLQSDNNKVVGGPRSSDQVVWDLGSNNVVIGMIHQFPGAADASQSRAVPQGKGVAKDMGKKGWLHPGW